MSVIRFNSLKKDNIILSKKSRTYSEDDRIIPIRYSKLNRMMHLMIQTPALKALSEIKLIGKNYYIDLELDPNDNEAMDFYEKIWDLDEHIIDVMRENWMKWFPRDNNDNNNESVEIDRDEFSYLYRSQLRTGKMTRISENVRIVKPYIRLKLSSTTMRGEPKLSAQLFGRVTGRKISTNDVNEGDEVVSIVRMTGILVSKTSYKILWEIVQMKLKNPKKTPRVVLNGPSYIDSDSDEYDPSYESEYELKPLPDEYGYGI